MASSLVHDVAAVSPDLNHPEQRRACPLQPLPISPQKRGILEEQASQEHCHAEGFRTFRLAPRVVPGTDHFDGQIADSGQRLRRMLLVVLLVEVHELSLEQQYSDLEVLLGRPSGSEDIAVKYVPQSNCTISVHDAEVESVQEVSCE